MLHYDNNAYTSFLLHAAPLFGQKCNDIASLPNRFAKNLASYDFGLFSKMKIKRFDTLEEIHSKSQAELKPSKIYSNCGKLTRTSIFVLRKDYFECDNDHKLEN